MEVKPLSSLNSLLSWDGPGNLENILKTLPELQPHSPPVSLYQELNKFETNYFKTLVCHDMKNGYLDDRFCFGTSNIEAYKFYHWTAIDTFVYFSHHFVTIPPCGWIHAAHIHGVKVLGTVITEWDEGESIWQQIFSDANILELTINNLVQIASTYRFEGWLLNIENKIDNDKINDLVYFTNELTKRMRLRNINSEVIWYDSVTCDGDLKWQNKLNDKNRCFFDVCDGIFLNYTWDESCLRESFEAAGNRIYDVYVGVDVYGRNFYEGGGFNTYKALKLIRDYNLSVAIFAQGWTYQVLGTENFFSNESKLWLSLDPFMLHRGPTKRPLETSFCQGFGKNMYHQGRVVQEGSWYNLSLQQIQPLWEEISRSSSYTCSIMTDDAFMGGSCLTLWIDKATSIRLMVCRISLSISMEFCFAYKIKGSISYLSFTFTSESRNTEEGQASSKSDLNFVAEFKDNDELVPSFSIFPKEKREENGWQIRRYFVLDNEGWITSFNIKANGPGLVIFGNMMVKDLGDKTE